MKKLISFSILFLFIFSKLIEDRPCIKQAVDHCCIQCNKNYHLVKGDCYVNILHCQQYSSDNQCVNCQEGYILNESKCIDKNVNGNGTNNSNNKQCKQKTKNSFQISSQQHENQIYYSIDSNNNKQILHSTFRLINQYQSNQYVKKIIEFLEKDKSTLFQTYQIVKVYQKYGFNQVNKYRFIVRVPVGIYQCYLNYNVKNNIANIKNQALILFADLSLMQSQFFNQDQENWFRQFWNNTLINNLVGLIQDQFSKFVSYELIFASQITKSNVYRFIFQISSQDIISIVFSYDQTLHKITILIQNQFKKTIQSDCQSISTNGKCSVCQQGYHLYQGKCFYDIGGCNKYHKGIICLSCAPIYLLINNKCESDCGVICNPQTGKQYGLIIQATPKSNCQNYLNGLCIKCIQGYYLKNSTCVYDQRDYQQQKNLQNCLVQNGYGGCSKCVQRYYLFQNKCNAISPNCSQYQNSGKCTVCYPGLYLNQNNTCMVSDPLCKQVLVDGNCSVCYVGYHLVNGHCIIQDNPLCMIFNNQQCLKCSFRSVMKDGICVEINQLCNTYDEITGLCTSCYGGYTLKQGKCVL